MRADVLIDEVLAKCDVLKSAGLWLTEPRMRPRAWLNNFDEIDRKLAATLLNKFTFYNAQLTDKLLIASYRSIADGMPKGPGAPPANILAQAINDAVFTPIRGEQPNPTDSGYLLCRKARQLLGVPEQKIVDTESALEHAYRGAPVIFVDDFVGSGDQFLKTWCRTANGRSFKDAQSKNNFVAIYITLITTASGFNNIGKYAPHVAICASHILEQRSTLNGISNAALAHDIGLLLDKYASRLTPKEDYIANNSYYLKFGYKETLILSRGRIPA